MINTSNKRNINLFFFILFLVGFFTFLSIGFQALSLSFSCMILLTIYIVLIQSIYKTSSINLYEDGRFYVFTFMFLYSIIVPIYALLSNIEIEKVRLIDIKNAGYFSLDEMTRTVWMSILLFMGILSGQWFFSKINTKVSSRTEAVYANCDELLVHRYKAKIWSIISIIAIIYFLLPFFRGGFSIIANGGNILDVQNNYSIKNNSIIIKFISMLFGSSIWMYSVIAYLYHIYNSDHSEKRKLITLIFVIMLNMFIIFATSRRAYSFIIILCGCIMYIKYYNGKINKYPITILLIMVSLLVIIYFAEGVIQNAISIKSMDLSTLLTKFDGFGPYEVLLSASKEYPDFTMLSNIIYGMFRNIPFIGKYIILLFGIDPSKPPLYLWLADKYNLIYSAGGGLACLPQIEAYLSLGYFGCFLFGVVYGALFAKKRDGLSNYFTIALSTTIARGSIQILFSEFWVGVFICYYIYEKIISKMFITSTLKRHRIQITSKMLNMSGE